MSGAGTDESLVVEATRGNSEALEHLLLTYSPRLLDCLRTRVPPDLSACIEAEDILQDTLTEAFRSIGQFESKGPGAFFGWLLQLAENRIRDAIKWHRAKKRGGGVVRIQAQKSPSSSSYFDLLGMVAVNEHTPSRSGARHEGALALHVAMAGLPDDYRKAIHLRYIRELTVAEVARIMGRTERAVQMLCYRGLRELRDALGRASKFLSSTE